MECAQINVTGGTGGTPAPTVSFPGAYAVSNYLRFGTFDDTDNY